MKVVILGEDIGHYGYVYTVVGTGARLRPYSDTLHCRDRVREIQTGLSMSTF